MAGYQPLKITGMSTGLVQNREEFLLPNDAYPVLQNAYVFRERILRKQGCQLLGRLQRNLTAQALGSTAADGSFTGNIQTILSLETTGQISPGSLILTIGSSTFTDAGNGTFGTNGGTINYSTMAITLPPNAPLATTAITAAFSYFPGLPTMGLRSREIASISTMPTIAFDTTYAYVFGTPATGWSEWIPGTTWTGSDSQFFWSTNFWTKNGARLMWVTNFNIGDPIRYTDGTSWTPFAPIITGMVTSPTGYMQQCLALLPFRGRMVAFSTIEGTNATVPYTVTSTNPQLIRWSAPGDPTLAGAWIAGPGKGGFISIPTSESITAVGFVRDNLVVYCERSTWQLRYTNNSTQPFAIERVNSELGTGSLFSAVQFDTSLVGIGDKGIVECDSYQSVRIDPQIPDLVFEFNQLQNGTQRISGVRDFINKLAFWTYPDASNNEFGNIYPNRRLVYNYDNKSWAIFTDSYTTLGTFQPLGSASWAQTPYSWASQTVPWIAKESGALDIVGGNQQGYVEYLDYQQGSDPSLSISAINTSPASIQVFNHNLQLGQIIQISGIPSTDPNAGLNGGVYSVTPTSANLLTIFSYDPLLDEFNKVVPLYAGFLGYGQISILDNFLIQSKKFNFMDEGQNIQLGYIDILMNETTSGAISLNLYLDYNTTEPINKLTQNQNPTTGQPDMFFNTIVPTTHPSGEPSEIDDNKLWHRIFCPVRGAFITVEWTLSNYQMANAEQSADVQIDAQILWLRKAGRLATGYL